MLSYGELRPRCFLHSTVMRDYRFPCYDTFSMIKSGSHLSNNVPDTQYGATVSRSHSKRPTTYVRDSLMHEQYRPIQPSVSALSRDKEDIVGCIESGSSEDKFLDVITVFSRYHLRNKDTIIDTDGWANSTERYQPVEEPWLLQLDVPPLSSEESFNENIGSTNGNVTFQFLENCSESESSPKYFSSDSNVESENVYRQVNVDENASWCFPDREHPTEDPWDSWMLYFPIEPLDITTQSVSDATTISEPTEDAQSLVDLQDKQHQASEKPLSGRESNLISQESSCSTEILINCSVCTMQRIAVLEDGCLVELLLEPVRSNVQCDSVYLGVVTKLVPHMGGALVNIGSSGTSLMDINSNREPFIFPPFSTTKKNDLNDSSSCIVEQAIFKQGDTGLSDYDPEVDFQDGDFEEREYKDNIGLGNQLNGNENHLKAQSGLLSHAQRHKSFSIIQAADETWALVRKGTKIVVQVVKERLGSKGPTLTAYPKLRSRFWILMTQCHRIGVSKKILGAERTRLKVIAKSLRPPGFGVTVRTVAAGHSMEELQKDLEGLLSTWRNIMEHAKSATLAADEGVVGAVPVILHQAMGQTLSVVQDYFNEKVKRMVVDSPRTYHEVTNYLQGIAPDLCERVELHRKNIPLFDEFNIEEEINNILDKRVALPNGGSLVIEQTEALVSIDVNGGHGMFGKGTSQEKAILDVNLAAAKQIARELRLRDIGGIIVVDFIDMMDDYNKWLIYEEFSKAVERDRSMVKASELSKNGLMEIIRKRVRPSVTFMISEPCTCCHGTGRVEALETSFSKIEHEICSLLASRDQKADLESPKSWPRLLLRVDTYMCDYLTSGKKKKLATLSSSLKVWILLKVARNFTRGAFELKMVANEKGNDNHHQVGVAMLPSEAEASKSTDRTKLFSVKKWKAGRK